MLYGSIVILVSQVWKEMEEYKYTNQNSSLKFNAGLALTDLEQLAPDV